MDPVATKLQVRLRDNLVLYGTKPTKDRLLAMACNPFTATVGMEELALLSDVLKEKAPTPEIKTMARDFKINAMKVLEVAIRDICSEIIPATTPPATATPVATVGAPAADPVAMMRRKRAQAKSSTLVAADETDPTKQQIRQFFETPFNIRQELLLQKRKLAPGVLTEIGHTQEQWVQRYDVISKNFDVMDWWERTGKQLYLLIYPIACLILPLPDSNGHQERAFSQCCYMDGWKTQEKTV
jgi:hAT family C-terminal dimerisation region